MSARNTTDPECAVIHFIVSRPPRVELTAHTVARLNITSLRAPKVDSAVHRPVMNCKRRLLVWVASISFGIVCLPLHALQVELTTEVEGGFQPMVKATSNLPDGMKLLVRVTRKESAFQFETPVEVQSGHFEVGPLSQSGGDLNPGIYSLQIVSVNPSEQPHAVRVAIGRKGDELHGPLTRRYAGATWVRLATTFQIGQAANRELDQARREQVKSAQTLWWRKKCVAICSGGERYSQHTGDPFDRSACLKTCISNPPTSTR